MKPGANKSVGMRDSVLCMPKASEVFCWGTNKVVVVVVVVILILF